MAMGSFSLISNDLAMQSIAAIGGTVVTSFPASGRETGSCERSFRGKTAMPGYPSSRSIGFGRQTSLLPRPGGGTPSRVSAELDPEPETGSIARWPFSGFRTHHPFTGLPLPDTRSPATSEGVLERRARPSESPRSCAGLSEVAEAPEMRTGARQAAPVSSRIFKREKLPAAMRQLDAKARVDPGPSVAEVEPCAALEEVVPTVTVELVIPAAAD